MTATYSVKDGGRLCVCPHMKCQHQNGKNYCVECDLAENGEHKCATFVDRAPETAEAA